MKRLNTIHWLLIIVFVIEAVVLGGVLIHKATNPPPVQLDITYTQNVNQSYPMISSLVNAKIPTITFNAGESNATFDGTAENAPTRLTNYYTTYGSFSNAFDSTVAPYWQNFRSAADVAVGDIIYGSNSSMKHIKTVANWYAVNEAYMTGNAGVFTVSFRGKSSEWLAACSKYSVEVDGETGKYANEMVLPANVTINGKTIKALAYTYINGDAYTCEVVFGDKLIDDATVEKLTIEILSPNAKKTLAETYMYVTFIANDVEDAFRSIFLY
jgi:hypothetical protein